MPRAVTSEEKRATPRPARNVSDALSRADWLLRLWISTTLKPKLAAYERPKRAAIKPVCLAVGKNTMICTRRAEEKCVSWTIGYISS